MSAGQIGCRPSEITISEETVGGDGFATSSENWVAECSGKRFICTQIDNRNYSSVGDGAVVATSNTNVSCKEELSSTGSSMAAAPPPAPAAPTQPPPAGGAGFELGATAEATQAACEAAGETWQRIDDNDASCSGAAAPLGFPAAVTFKLCSGSVCLIGLEHRPESDWIGSIAELRGKLEAKYGPPREREGEISENCRSKAAFVGCLQTRNVRLRYLWLWPTGQSITLLVGIPREGGEAAIRVDYAKPRRALAVNESAL